MAKTIDLTQNVAALCDEYPELVNILVDLGFKPLANPMMRAIAGTHMTIPKAAQTKGVPLEKILFALAQNGFSVTGVEAADGKAQAPQTEEEKKEHAHEPGHVFLARMGKTRLRPGGVDATDWLLSKAQIDDGAKILEVACNMGTTLIQVAEQHNGCSLTGLDLDPEALAHAKENVKAHHLEDRISLVQGSAFELPFPDESFDIVINEAMLTMLVGEQKDKALAEYHRVLKPDGLLLTQDVCLRTEDADEQKNIRAGISRAINVNVEPLTREGWKQKFESHGFRTEEKVGPMTLLDPEGMEHDEGQKRTRGILLNAMQTDNSDFFERMFGFFQAHKDQLGYIAVVSRRSE